jgi:hypothetical protein
MTVPSVAAVNSHIESDENDMCSTGLSWPEEFDVVGPLGLRLSTLKTRMAPPELPHARNLPQGEIATSAELPIPSETSSDCRVNQVWMAKRWTTPFDSEYARNFESPEIDSPDSFPTCVLE